MLNPRNAVQGQTTPNDGDTCACVTFYTVTEKRRKGLIRGAFRRS